MIKPQDSMLTESDAKQLVDDITSICDMYQSATMLPEESSLNQNPHYYLDAIIEIFQFYNLLE